MATLKIFKIPNVILTKKAKEVKVFDKKMKQLIADMKQALISAKNPQGIGLAAPQVGKLFQIFIARSELNSPIKVYINPQILWHSKDYFQQKKEKEFKLEGCLSLDNIWGVVNRYKTCKLEFRNIKGEKHIETFKDFMATIIQHEADHLNGILFPKRVLEQKNKLYTLIDENGKEKLQELTI